jgi:hypothetical protein
VTHWTNAGEYVPDTDAELRRLIREGFEPGCPCCASIRSATGGGGSLARQ